MENKQREYRIVGNVIGDMLDDMLFYKAVDKVKSVYKDLKSDLRMPEKPIYSRKMHGGWELSAVPLNTRSFDERRLNTKKNEKQNKKPKTKRP